MGINGINTYTKCTFTPLGLVRIQGLLLSWDSIPAQARIARISKGGGVLFGGKVDLISLRGGAHFGGKVDLCTLYPMEPLAQGGSSDPPEPPPPPRLRACQLSCSYNVLLDFITRHGNHVAILVVPL